MKALISSDYFKSTVDLRRCGSGVTKPPCALPGFVHKYTHRCPEFSTCTDCAFSVPSLSSPRTSNRRGDTLSRKNQQLTAEHTSRNHSPKSMCQQRASTSAGQHGGRGRLCFLLALAPFLPYLPAPSHRCPPSPSLPLSLLSLRTPLALLQPPVPLPCAAPSWLLLTLSPFAWCWKLSPSRVGQETPALLPDLHPAHLHPASSAGQARPVPPASRQGIQQEPKRYSKS